MAKEASALSVVWHSCLALLLLSAVACGGSTPAAPSGTRVIALSGNLAFGNVPVGHRSAPQILTISNQGNSTLTVTGLTLAGGNVFSPGFSGGTIPAGVSQAVAITFAPTLAQSYNGVLTVNGDQTGGVNTIAVSGVGLSADLQLVPGQGHFVACDGTGACLFTASMQNAGSICASGTSVVVRFFDASGAQLGPDVPMDASEPLLTRIIRPQDVVSISSLALVGSDVTHSTQTYKLFPTWDNLICP